MNYFAIQVKTRSENKFIKLFKNNNLDTSFSLHFPQRQMRIRKEGKYKDSLSAVFPDRKRIIKVDKRKGRAKISLDLYNDSFSIDLSFEVLEPVKTSS